LSGQDLFKAGKRQGWLAFEFADGAVSIANVVRRTDSHPRVEICDSYRCEGGELDTLIRLRKSLKLDTFRCTLNLQFGEYHFLQVDPPNVPADELRQALRWSIKGMVDFPVDQATLDVLEVPADKEGHAKARFLYVAVASNEVVGRHVRLFQDAGLDLAAIDVPEMAQRNVSALFEAQDRSIAMLGFSGAGGLLTFGYRGELLSARRIDVSLKQLVEAGEDQRQAMFERIGLELQRSLDTFERQFTFVSLGKLVVSPIAGELGLTTYLSGNLYVGVETADLGKAMDLAKVPTLRQPGSQAQRMMLVGSAMRNGD
jgi:MSHA biogenesis protein MshI